MINQKNTNFILSLIVYICCISIPQQTIAVPPVYLEKDRQINLENSSIIDYWTQHFFDLLRPELVNQEKKNYSNLHQREKTAISEVVTYVLSYSCQRSQNNYFILTKITNSNEVDKYPRYRYYPKGNNRNLYNRERTSELVPEDENIHKKDFYWRPHQQYFFEGLYQDLTDAIFYARHPELSVEENKKIQHLNWAAEWNFIRRHFINYNQERKIIQSLIPVCHKFENEN